MGNSIFKISGTGCALVDYLYKPVSFSDADFGRYISRKAGDGGLSPGKLVFREEFERFSGEDYITVRDKITGGKQPIAMNIGGPSIVSLIHAAQMLQGLPAEVRFYGSKGLDEGAAFLASKIKQTPIHIGKYKTVDLHTPFTDVMSDPDYDNGNGERIFINNIGAAWEMYPDDLDDSFFESNIVAFGGTALVPHMHQSLLELLKKSKEKGAVTVVNTVYDFLNEKKNPSKAWPLGESIETYKYIDLLIADMEEACRLSGMGSIEAAMAFFKSTGVGAVIVTHGANAVHFFSRGRLFGNIDDSNVPVSEKVKSEIALYPVKVGDTTGCGDNFAGGVIASIARQMMAKPQVQVNLLEAIAMGVVSGGYACFYHGGTFYEEYPQQKIELIDAYYQDYLIQIGL